MKKRSTMPPGPVVALQEFDALLQQVAAFHAARMPPAQGHAPAILADRLTQRFAQLFQAEFVVRRCDPIASDGMPMCLSGLNVDLASGRLHVSAALATRLFIDFLLRWGYTLLALLLSMRIRTGRKRATLLYGVGADDAFRDGSDAEFADFCEQGPIAPLRKAQALIVQAVQPRASSSPRIRYARSPLHALCRGSGFGLADALKLTWRHAAAFANFLSLAATMPASVLIARDFADAAPASMLDEAGLVDAVVLTNSNYSSQPLWLRARPGRVCQTHMIWYSQNVRPLLRKFDPELPANPINRMIRADVMWVWTQAFAEYLAAIGVQAQMHWVGPILWRMPGPATPAPDIAPLVSVFDVAPVTEAEAVKLGLIENYYSTKTAKKFLQDIVDAVERISQAKGVRVRIALKHKRERTKIHDPQYFLFVESLVAENECFNLHPTQTSLYELIANSALAISIPYSSPVYVASHLSRASLFYDPTGALRPTFDAAPGLEFAATPDALQSAIARAVERR